MAQTTAVDGVYVLKRKIGQGGMAAVYLAEVDLNRFDYTTLYAYTQVHEDTHLQRRLKAEELAEKLRGQNLDLATLRAVLDAQGIPTPGQVVAVKVATGEATDLARFEGEWKNLMCLNHDNVVKVYGGGIYMKRPYYAMELLENTIPPKRVREEFTIQEKIEIVMQAGRGLAYLHQNGIVHRDVKPDNAVVCEVSPGQYVTKITDLGLAKNLDASMGMTMSQTVMGTPHYMSPEQIESSKNVDHRADIYSLGATLYELVTGIKPYHDKSTVYEVISAVARGEKPVRPKEHLPGLPDVVASIIECAMERDLSRRYRKMSDFVSDLERYASEESGEVTLSRTFKDVNREKSTAKLGFGRYQFERLRQRQEAAGPKIEIGPSQAVRAEKPPQKEKIGKKPRENRSPYIAVGIAAALLLGVVLWALSPGGDTKKPVKPRESAPTRTVKSKPTAPVEKMPITPEQLHAALKAKNPDYNGKGEFVAEDGRIVEVKLSGAGVNDISPLAGLPLRKLGLYSCRGVTDIAALKGMPLKELVLSGCSSLKDIGPLRGMQITSLNLVFTPVSDLSPLKGMPLAELQLRCENTSDLTPLVGLPLKTITFYTDEFPDLAPLKALPLKSVQIITNAEHLPDFSRLRGLQLDGLRLVCPRLKDLTPIRGIHVAALSIVAPNVSDVTPLRGMSFERLQLDSASISDLTPMRDISLKLLDIGKNPVRDLSPLKGVTLEALHIENTQISDLSPLKGVPLKELNVSDCANLSDVSPLAGMNLVTIFFTPRYVTKGVEVIRGMKALTAIGTDYLHTWPTEEFWKKYDAGEFGMPGEPPKPGKVPTTLEELHAALKAKNPGYSGKGQVVVEDGKIVEVRLDGTNVDDISPVAGLPLRKFRIQHSAGLCDISVLKGMPLKEVVLNNCPLVRDISVLEGMKITSLNILGAPVSDLSCLKGMPLTELALYPDPIGDMTPLSDMPLHTLTMMGAKFPSFAPLKNAPLKELCLFVNAQPLPDLLPLYGKPLDFLRVSQPRLTDLWSLRGMRAKRLLIEPGENALDLAFLKTMGVEDLGLDRVPDLSPLRGLPLKILRLNKSFFRDLTPLRGMPLGMLVLSECDNVSDLRPLDGMNLDEILLNPQKITQGMEVLRRMKSLKVIWTDSAHSWPAAEFWKKYDAGEFGKPGVPPKPRNAPTSAEGPHAALKGFPTLAGR